jgi:tRNA(fMet)-specific endonuclease VapC
MSKSYLLDTNAVIARINGDDSFDKYIEIADEIFIASIVLGELYYGARNSGRIEENLTQIEKIVMSGVVLGCNIDTARWYGRIAAQLKTIGRPIPQNDIWIAAIARQYELTMLTRDKHFENVDGLVVESWL